MNESTFAWSDLGNRLKTTRRMRGYSQEVVAGKLGISVGRLRDFEYGRRPMTVDVLVALAQLLEVGVDFLATGRDESIGLCSWRLRSPCAQRRLPHGVTLRLRRRRDLFRQCPRGLKSEE